MLHISGNTIQHRFISAVEGLKLRFPGAVIAKKTGYNKGTVSAYLKNLEPSEAFIKTFCQQFEIDFELIWTGKMPKIKKAEEEKQPEPSAMEILTMLAQAFKDQSAAHKEHAETLKLQANILSSIESKMAQQADQLTIKEKVQTTEARTKKMEEVFMTVRRDVTTLVERQELGIEEFRERFDKISAPEKTASAGVRKK